MGRPFRSVSLDDGEVEWGSKGLSSLFARKKNALSPGFYSMLREMTRFNREAPRLLELDDEDPRKVPATVLLGIRHHRLTEPCRSDFRGVQPAAVGRVLTFFGASHRHPILGGCDDPWSRFLTELNCRGGNQVPSLGMIPCFVVRSRVNRVPCNCE